MELAKSLGLDSSSGDVVEFNRILQYKLESLTMVYPLHWEEHG
jgi:hypothetical protein